MPLCTRPHTHTNTNTPHGCLENTHSQTHTAARVSALAHVRPGLCSAAEDSCQKWLSQKEPLTPPHCGFYSAAVSLIGCKRKSLEYEVLNVRKPQEGWCKWGPKMSGTCRKKSAGQEIKTESSPLGQRGVFIVLCFHTFCGFSKSPPL